MAKTRPAYILNYLDDHTVDIVSPQCLKMLGGDPSKIFVREINIPSDRYNEVVGVEHPFRNWSDITEHLIMYINICPKELGRVGRTPPQTLNAYRKQRVIGAM